MRERIFAAADLSTFPFQLMESRVEIVANTCHNNDAHRLNSTTDNNNNSKKSEKEFVWNSYCVEAHAVAGNAWVPSGRLIHILPTFRCWCWCYLLSCAQTATHTHKHTFHPRHEMNRDVQHLTSFLDVKISLFPFLPCLALPCPALPCMQFKINYEIFWHNARDALTLRSITTAWYVQSNRFWYWLRCVFDSIAFATCSAPTLSIAYCAFHSAAIDAHTRIFQKEYLFISQQNG